MWFHADGAAPDPRFFHGRAPPGCDGSSKIQDPALYQDLCDRQRSRLRQGQGPHSKLKGLLECPLLTGPAWFRPDMSSEQQMLTFQAFLVRPPQWTRDWAGARGFCNRTIERCLPGGASAGSAVLDPEGAVLAVRLGRD